MKGVPKPIRSEIHFVKEYIYEPIKILRLNRKHLSQMTYYFTSFQDNSCSHDGQSSICRIHSMQYIPVTPNMRDYNLLDSLGVAPDLEQIGRAHV